MTKSEIHVYSTVKREVYAVDTMRETELGTRSKWNILAHSLCIPCMFKIYMYIVVGLMIITIFVDTGMATYSYFGLTVQLASLMLTPQC